VAGMTRERSNCCDSSTSRSTANCDIYRGMWMKTALASSLAYRRRLIVLDFSGLDQCCCLCDAPSRTLLLQLLEVPKFSN
jgi:hypothetical protein